MRFSFHFSLDTTQTIWKFSRLKLVHKSLYLVFTFPALLLPWWGLRPRLPGGTWSWSLDRTGTRTPSPSTRQHLLFYFPHFYWGIICFSIIRSSNRIRYRSSSRDSIFHICIYIFILFSSISLLVLHKDEVEDTVEYSIDEVRESQIENEEVCNCSHPLVPCKQHVNKMSGRLIFWIPNSRNGDTKIVCMRGIMH